MRNKSIDNNKLLWNEQQEECKIEIYRLILQNDGKEGSQCQKVKKGRLDEDM